MRRLRQLADRTPPSRERYIDLLRALAITAVVLGHWLITVIRYAEDGRLTGHSALEYLPWAYPLTWLVQVMPVFFVVGGYANAASLTSYRRRGGDAVAWLQQRSGRLVRPTTALLVVLAGAALSARLLGADPGQVRRAVWVASIPLWFLSAYLVVVLLTPPMWRLHQRFGLAVPLVLVVLVAAGDAARLAGAAAFGNGNFLFGWLAIHQVGFVWRDGRLPAGPRAGVPLLAGGLVTLLLLTVVGPYPVSMIDIPGQRIKNASPPTVALLATAATQLGLILLLRERAERWLRRTRPWRAVVTVNAVILTIFLWHMSAVLLLVGALAAAHLLPTPAAGTAAWWLWRPPWLIMLIPVLAVLVAIFGRIETRHAPHPQARPRWIPVRLGHWLTQPGAHAPLTVAGYTATVSGLLANNLAAQTGHEHLGVPTEALVAFLLGAAALRLLRSVPTNP
jgi:peptidoglycan/LPS O-acetylase OafA/YrhL